MSKKVLVCTINVDNIKKCGEMPLTLKNSNMMNKSKHDESCTTVPVFVFIFIIYFNLFII